MENERNKPDCPLIGQDGNVFNLIGMASRTLKDNGIFAVKNYKGVIVMRKNFGTKPWFYPLPVLIIGTYDENGNKDRNGLTVPKPETKGFGTVC